MTGHVLDASALLALLLEEAGADRVAEIADGATISAVNLSEVGARCSDLGIDLDTLFDKMSKMRLIVVPFDRVQSETAAKLRAATRNAGLSLGDRACLALAQIKTMPVLTADRAWQSLDLDLPIELIR